MTGKLQMPWLAAFTSFLDSSSLLRVYCQVKNSLTICLFISPDLDGHRAPKMDH